MNSEEVEVVTVDEDKTIDVIKDHVEGGQQSRRNRYPLCLRPVSGRALGKLSLWYCHAIPQEHVHVAWQQGCT